MSQLSLKKIKLGDNADTSKNFVISEEWRDIAGFEGLYQVSSIGRVKCLSKPQHVCPHCGEAVSKLLPEKIMSPSIKRNGYAQLTLTKDGVRSYFMVHRLVATTFLDCQGINVAALEVNHIDFNKLNNAASNLEWKTRVDNVRHAVEGGRCHAETNPNRSPFNNPKTSHVLDGDKVRAIRALLADGTKQRLIAELFGVSESTISAIKNNQQWVDFESEECNVAA